MRVYRRCFDFLRDVFPSKQAKRSGPHNFCANTANRGISFSSNCAECFSALRPPRQELQQTRSNYGNVYVDECTQGHTFVLFSFSQRHCSFFLYEFCFSPQNGCKTFQCKAPPTCHFFTLSAGLMWSPERRPRYSRSCRRSVSGLESLGSSRVEGTEKGCYFKYSVRNIESCQNVYGSVGILCESNLVQKGSGTTKPGPRPRVFFGLSSEKSAQRFLDFAFRASRTSENALILLCRRSLFLP